MQNAQAPKTPNFELPQKRISLKTQNPEKASGLVEKFDLHPVAAAVLAARGFEANELTSSFLTPTLKSGLPKPEDLKGLAAAAKRIRDAIKNKERIALCCDFDVDGLSGGAQAVSAIESVGGTIDTYVPNRFTEGYGLNLKMIEKIAASGATLLITVDFGTSNRKEIEAASKANIDSIIVDHHEVAEAPPATIFVNPQQDGCGFADGTLAAAGLAWYLVIALSKHFTTLDPKSFLDLACLGTICDMVPLHGANRIIAKRGLELVTSSMRPGIIALRNVLGLKRQAKCSDISFGIGPRLNAAGRMLDGNLVLKLLTTNDLDEAKKLAKKLDKLNEERQGVEVQVHRTARSQVLKLEELPGALICWDKSFHTGVIGIVAQRLVEEFHRPSIVLGQEESGIFKGSVRGIKGIHVLEALQSASSYIEQFGGHKAAAGLSIKEDKLDDFAATVSDFCLKTLTSDSLVPFVEADTEADFDSITFQLIHTLQSFAPFGIGNAQPTLLIKNLRVASTKVLKNAHLKVMLSNGTRVLSAFLWRKAEHPALYPGNTVNVACRPSINRFNGLEELQLTLEAAENA